MATALGIASLIVASIGTGYGIYSGEETAAANKKSRSEAKDAALKQESLNDQANNRANQKHPNANAILAAAQAAAKSGIGGTMLTGPQGIGTDQLTLGKSTLLGG
jgi:hypothetical protein